MSYEKPKSEVESNLVQLENFRNSNEKMLRAIEIMGGDFFPRGKVEKALGIKIDPETIPEIPFSEDELKRAKELNQFLILRVERTINGQNLTIENMSKLLKGKLNDGGRFLYDDDKKGNIPDHRWFKNENFATHEVPRIGWALTTKDLIPDTKGRNSLDQIQLLVGYLKDQVYRNGKMPKELEGAVLEFDEKKDEIKHLLNSRVIGGHEEAVKEMSNLKINKILRPSPVEIIYDMCVFSQNTGRRLLNNKDDQTLTSSFLPNGSIVRLGSNDKNGLVINFFQTQGTSDRIGSIYSQSR